jgi:ubiquinone/menaquinone biosynthesis C-methylase UbiE
MLPRVLEPEAMDTVEEAREYDAMDHAAVNGRFVAEFLAAHGSCRGGEILDVGTGPGRIAVALCLADPAARVLALDLAEAMLDLARRNIAQAGLTTRIECVLGDAKALAWPDGRFEAVISNTIVHHIPDPLPALAEMARLVAPGGTLFVRDLARPATSEEVASLVATHVGGESPSGQALFAASLHAALTVAELRTIARTIGLPQDGIAMTSDRHWTWVWNRAPGAAAGDQRD